MKYPPKHRKTYGKSLRRIAKKLGLQYVKTKKARVQLRKRAKSIQEVWGKDFGGWQALLFWQ